MPDYIGSLNNYDTLAPKVGCGAVQRDISEPWLVFLKLPRLEMDFPASDARKVAAALIEYAKYAESKNPKPKKARKPTAKAKRAKRKK